jgi:hypothetical protein
MRSLLLTLVIALFLPASASLHTGTVKQQRFRHPAPAPKCVPKPAPTPTPTPTTTQPAWTVVDAAGATVGVPAGLGRDGVATVLVTVGTEAVAVNVSATGWTVEGGGPLYYAAPDCAGDPFTPLHVGRSLTPHAFGAYVPEEGVNDTTLYIADATATPQDVVVYSMRARTADDACMNTGGTAPTTLYPVRAYSTAMAAFRGPFVVRTAR